LFAFSSGKLEHKIRFWWNSEVTNLCTVKSLNYSLRKTTNIPFRQSTRMQLSIKSTASFVFAKAVEIFTLSIDAQVQ